MRPPNFSLLIFEVRMRVTHAGQDKMPKLFQPNLLQLSQALSLFHILSEEKGSLNTFIIICTANENDVLSRKAL